MDDILMHDEEGAGLDLNTKFLLCYVKDGKIVTFVEAYEYLDQAYATRDNNNKQINASLASNKPCYRVYALDEQ